MQGSRSPGALDSAFLAPCSGRCPEAGFLGQQLAQSTGRGLFRLGAKWRSPYTLGSNNYFSDLPSSLQTPSLSTGAPIPPATCQQGS